MTSAPMAQNARPFDGLSWCVPWIAPLLDVVGSGSNWSAVRRAFNSLIYSFRNSLHSSEKHLAKEKVPKMVVKTHSENATEYCPLTREKNATKRKRVRVILVVAEDKKNDLHDLSAGISLVQLQQIAATDNVKTVKSASVSRGGGSWRRR